MRTDKSLKLELIFMMGHEPPVARAEVLMQEAVEAMYEVAAGLTDYHEPPIAVEVRRKVCLKLCAETFDRMERERRIWSERLMAQR